VVLAVRPRVECGDHAWGIRADALLELLAQRRVAAGVAEEREHQLVAVRPDSMRESAIPAECILGGVIVRVRDRMVDLSVRGRLEALRLSLRNARLGSTGGES